MRVNIPTPLTSYTHGSRCVDIAVKSAGVKSDVVSDVGALLRALDETYPGLRFRIIDEQDHIREHIGLFINGSRITSIANASVSPKDEIHIIAALSGG